MKLDNEEIKEEVMLHHQLLASYNIQFLSEMQNQTLKRFVVSKEFPQWVFTTR